MSQTEGQMRLEKLKHLQNAGINPYPTKGQRSHLAKDILDNFSQLSKKKITICGRLMIMRNFGRLAFAKLQDSSGQIQLVFEEQNIGKDNFKKLRLLDSADIISATGQTFTTQKGEPSLLIENYTLLSKALEPLPEKWHGLTDEETRYRKRYLDLLLNSDLQELFRKKAIFWQSMREFLLQQNFLEVETPVLESTPGGADAEPFITHHNALDINLYLRISMGELWQKRLMVAGFERTFEIGRQFRNEGIDPEHLQDYTQMEFYLAYANYEDTMALVEKMYKYVIKKTFKTLQFKIKGFTVDFAKPWKKIDYVETIENKFGINVITATEKELLAKCKDLKLGITKGSAKGRLMDLLWKQVRKEIAGPVFLVNQPVEVSPLAKRKPDDPTKVERYQIIIAGSENGNGYSELNDPIDQEARFKAQAKLRKAGDNEAQMHDQDFVTALRHGMPPTSGFGVSERLFSFLADKPIRECVLFPLLRPKQ